MNMNGWGGIDGSNERSLNRRIPNPFPSNLTLELIFSITNSEECLKENWRKFLVKFLKDTYFSLIAILRMVVSFAV